eukprot:CAMPEP_0169319098 /NCGR_PEP_ID=MMETSP1017-20121227/7647_1 /TAXON_ID=342587 /ORGANISM="Karlodinium micrum, Strain CCMP2283" /LENGTH=425 /DNA_ID=CAMNT_0009413435 /DNA_START=49 /DNA_END=1326 /DNA_ORIENTATION=+
MACGVSCCCTCVCGIVLYFLIGIIGGKYFVDTPVGWGWAESLTACDEYWCGPGKGPYLTPQNFTRYLRWGEIEPAVGYKTDEMVNKITCYNPKQFYDMETFNANADWEAVYYLSRPDPEGKAEQVQLMAWLLKAPKRRSPHTANGSPPRIVVQHGVGANQNNRFTQYAAYDLRAMGFDVLVPGFRNHGWSGKSKHDRTTWGWIYPLDLLGGWDYAVNDPEGKFGGPVDPRKVGILGISLGAMTTSTAFGMEKRVHAAFIDSGPSSPYSELEHQISMIPNPIRALLMPVIWWGAKWWAGVDLGRYIPEKYIPNCENDPYIRHAAVVSSSLDTFVPIEEDMNIIQWLGSSPTCYNVDTVFLPPDTCKGLYHGYELYLSPDLYRLHACNFFTKAFDLSCDYCQLDTLPWYKILDKTAQESAIHEVCGK